MAFSANPSLTPDPLNSPPPLSLNPYSDLQTFMASLIPKIGPYYDQIESIINTNATAWMIIFDDATTLDAELDLQTGRLVFSADIGTPLKERALTVYETVLSYTLLWQDTGGIRMGLAGPGGALVLIADVIAPWLDEERLLQVVIDIKEKTRLWREFVEADDAPQPSSLDLNSHLQV